MRDVLEVIKNRRSIRKYKTDQISQESLDKIIEAGIYSPTANNQQPWHFTVIQNPELLKKINAASKDGMAKSNEEWTRKMGLNPDFRVTYDAPTLIVVSGRQDSLSWRVDCAAAIENMLIAAESLNIGSVWLGLVRFFLEDSENVASLGIPEGYQPFYAVAFGYRADDGILPAPKRNKNVVNYIR